MTAHKAPSQQAAPALPAPRHNGSGKLLSLQSASSLQATLEGTKASSVVPPPAAPVAAAPSTPPAADAQPMPLLDGLDSRRSSEEADTHKVEPCSWPSTQSASGMVPSLTSW